LASLKGTVRDVPGFPGYFVDDDGSVYSARSGRTRPLKQMRADGRSVVTLYRDGVGKKQRGHALVLAAFVGPRPPGAEGCHFPERDTSNNHLSNLRWDTRAGNEADKAAHGTSNHGERNGSARLHSRDIPGIRAAHARGATYADLATRLGVSPSAVEQVCNFKTWKEVR
jgi:hypothetical protein